MYVVIIYWGKMEKLKVLLIFISIEITSNQRSKSRASPSFLFPLTFLFLPFKHIFLCRYDGIYQTYVKLMRLWSMWWLHQFRNRIFILREAFLPLKINDQSHIKTIATLYFTYYNFLFHQTHKQTYPKAIPCYFTCVEFQVIAQNIVVAFANSNKYSVWANWRVMYEKYSNKDFPLILYENVYLLLLVNSNFDLLNFQELIWMFLGKLAIFFCGKIGNYFSSIVFNRPLNQKPLVRVCMIFSNRNKD